MFLEEIDSVWSSAAPRRTPARLRLRNPAGEGAEVAGRRCGGLGQEGMLQKHNIYPSHPAVHERCSVIVRSKERICFSCVCIDPSDVKHLKC